MTIINQMKKNLVVMLFLIALFPTKHVWADEPFVGEIRWVAFNFAPMGWAFCDGSLIPISQNTALFSLLGTTYGGNGQTTFALPDLRGRAPVHATITPPSPVQPVMLGQTGGEAAHTLTLAETPPHGHALMADPQEANSSVATGNYPAKTSGGSAAYGKTATGAMAATPVAFAGGSQPHDNMKPFVTLNCIIALQGIYPSRN